MAGRGSPPTAAPTVPAERRRVRVGAGVVRGFVRSKQTQAGIARPRPFRQSAGTQRSLAQARRAFTRSDIITESGRVAASCSAMSVVRNGRESAKAV